LASQAPEKIKEEVLMKKALLIMLALVLITSVAFAQAGVKVGAWGRGFFAVAGSSQANTDIQLAPATIGWWTGNGPRIGVNLIGSSENVGFQIDIITDQVTGGSASPITINNNALQPKDVIASSNLPIIGDQCKIWVKPISMMTVQVGYSCYDDALRGSAGFGMYNWVRMANMPGDDFIFQRVAGAGNGDGPGANFELALDPIEGLHAFYAIRGTSATGTGPEKLMDGIKVGMAGAGYTIPGIGQLRAQWLGKDSTTGYSQVAFKLTAIPGLSVDIGDTTTFSGAAVDLAVTESDICITAGYAVMPTLSLNVIYQQQLKNLNAKSPATMAMGYYGGIEAEYALPGDMVITGDIRVDGTDTVGTYKYWGGLVSIQKNFSNGLIGIGVEVTNDSFAGPLAGGGAADGSTIQFAVPVRVEYWF
jgi:hypothetical protein